jgi:hypothetical protein
MRDATLETKRISAGNAMSLKGFIINFWFLGVLASWRLILD